MIRLLLILQACSLLQLGCTKKSVFEAKEENDVRVVGDLPDDFKVPISLWETIEGKQEKAVTKAAAPAEHGGKEGAAEGEGIETKGSIIFAPARVILVEKNEGVLTKPRLQFDFPRGGGVIDLSQVTTGVEGSFYFGIEIPEIVGLVEFKTYYLSEARKRKIDGEIYGAGCQAYMDISQRMTQSMSKEGLKVNTVRNRHTSVLAGHFILTALKEKQTLVTQVHMIDSKNSNLLCEVTDESNPKNSRQ